MSGNAESDSGLTTSGDAGVIVQAGESRLSRLESLRAIAALAVLMAHVYAYAHNWSPVIYRGYLHRAVMAGGLGVQLFFGLSGYLLYRAFARRDFADGQVDIRRYAINRALRILPLYYVVVVVLLVFTQHGGSGTQWWRFLLFFEEFSTKTAQTVDGPMWSLVVEVIFYILLPVTAWFLARVSRGAAWKAVTVLAFAGALSAYLHHRNPQPVYIWYYSFPSTFYGFVPGMVLALLEVSWRRELPGYLTGPLARSDVWVVLSLLTWALTPVNNSSSIYFTVPASFLLIGACVLPLTQKRIVRVLDWRPLAAVGVASYSLYLWHVPIIQEIYRHLPSGTAVLLVVALPASLAAAAASYAVVERPALRFRSRWAGAPTASLDPAGAAANAAPGSYGRAEDLSWAKPGPDPSAGTLDAPA